MPSFPCDLCNLHWHRHVLAPFFLCVHCSSLHWMWVCNLNQYLISLMSFFYVLYRLHLELTLTDGVIFQSLCNLHRELTLPSGNCSKPNLIWFRTRIMWWNIAPTYVLYFVFLNITLHLMIALYLIMDSVPLLFDLILNTWRMLVTWLISWLHTNQSCLHAVSFL